VRQAHVDEVPVEGQSVRQAHVDEVPVERQP